MQKVGARSIDVACIPESELRDFVSSAEDSLLAVIYYGMEPAFSLPENCLQIIINLPQIGSSGLVEVWTTELPCESHRTGNISYSSNSDLIFATLSVHENDERGLEELTRLAYREFLDVIHSAGYPHLIRIWNYFPHINDDQNGVERYKQFCAGRSEAFSERPGGALKEFPAANAVGTGKGPLAIYCLASKKKASHQENSRQVSAYMYPEQYGRHSPSFARATFKDWGKYAQFYISGTASIVGHESRHPDDLVQQVREISRNVKALLDAQFHQQGRGDGNRFAEDMAMMKIYLRDRKLFPVIKEEWENKLGWKGPALYLLGDICRSELLLEIEGIWLARC